jgi:hypothetical protein
MNKQIKELIEQATIKGEEYLPGNDGHPTPTFYFDKEKFAELIVGECADIANQWQVSEHPGLLVRDVIIQHFGVKE